MTEVSTKSSVLSARGVGALLLAPGYGSRLARLRVRLTDARLQFMFLVVVPTALASLYYGLIASPEYVSHTEYLVRGVESHQSVGIASLLQTLGISRTADDASAIESFIKSREAIAQLDERVNLREVLGRSGADFMARFPRFWERDTFEALYAHSQDFISVIQDQSTGVTKLDVAAFTAADARRVALALLSLAEDMANRMNARAQSDTISQAKKEVEDARDNVLNTQMDLTNFRNKELLVDPLSFAGVLLDGIGQLSLSQAQTQAKINETQSLSPSNPGLSSLRAHSDALASKISEEREKLAGTDVALAEKVAVYERLTLQRDLADKRYATSLVSLLTAQSEARRKRVYIEEIVPANLPDQDTKPERLRMIFSILVMSFTIFAIFWIITVGSKDHAQ